VGPRRGTGADSSNCGGDHKVLFAQKQGIET
jgi:hypothetical protein